MRFILPAVTTVFKVNYFCFIVILVWKTCWTQGSSFNINLHVVLRVCRRDVLVLISKEAHFTTLA